MKFFVDTAEIDAIAELSHEVNTRMENIGARRLHTIMEQLLEEISFEAPKRAGEEIAIDRAYVMERLKDVVQSHNLSQYIL